MNEAEERDSDLYQKPASAEDKFFGVKTVVEKKKKKPVVEEDSDIEVEVIEERPAKKKGPARAKGSDPDEAEDEELGRYSERVQKRLNKLKFDYHEERRQKETAEQMREEAVAVAQQFATKTKEQEALIARGESALVDQIKERAQVSLQSAENAYRQAYEEGDTDKIISTQQKMNKSQTELHDIDRYKTSMDQQAQNQRAYQEQNYQQEIARRAAQNVAYQQQQAPQVTPQAQEWAEKNDWFMKEGHEEMTALAYGSHTAAVRQGMAPSTEEYFSYIDDSMRNAFPDYGWVDNGGQNSRGESVTHSRPSSVVAPSSRSNGAKPRSVRLEPSEVSLAKRLGITNKQYADQRLLLERRTNDG